MMDQSVDLSTAFDIRFHVQFKSRCGKFRSN